MGKRRMASVLNFLLLLLWLDHGTSTAVMEPRVGPSRSMAARMEDDDRSSTHPESGPANLTSCPKYQDTEGLLTQLTPCLPAVSIISTTPNAECCSRLHADGLTCLCSLFEQYRSRIPRGIVRYNRIIQLPKECNLPIRDGTTCDGIPVPTTEANAVLDSADKSDAISSAWFTRGFTLRP